MHRFVRHDLMSTDPKRAAPFYAELFGWTTKDVQVPMMGGFTVTRLLLGDRVLGAIMPFDPKHGVPSHWMGYVEVADVDACCKRVPELGGVVGMPPTTIPPGRFAILTDPGKGWLSPFAPKEPPPVFDRGTVGAFSWHELHTTDAAAARRFYEGLFGWTSRDTPMPGGTYTVFDDERGEVGGMMTLREGSSHGPQWLPYVRVEDAARAADRAAKLGAKVPQPPREIEGGVRVVAIDPTGAALVLYSGA